MNYKKRERKKMLERGLVPTAGSGNKPFWQGDGQDEDWLVEYKYTGSQQYILKTKDWNKVEKEALLAHKRPRMEIEMGDGNYLVILAKEDFDELCSG